MPWLLEEREREVVLLIDLISMLRFHAEFLLAVGRLLYCVHPMFEGLSGVVPMWRLLLGIGTHERCLLMDGRILLIVFQRARRLVLTLMFLSFVL